MNQMVCILQRELCDLHSTLDRKYLLGVPSRVLYLCPGLAGLALLFAALPANHQHAASRYRPIRTVGNSLLQQTLRGGPAPSNAKGETPASRARDGPCV